MSSKHGATRELDAIDALGRSVAQMRHDHFAVFYFLGVSLVQVVFDATLGEDVSCPWIDVRSRGWMEESDACEHELWTEEG